MLGMGTAQTKVSGYSPAENEEPGPAKRRLGLGASQIFGTRVYTPGGCVTIMITPCSLSISYPQHGDGRRVTSLTITDDISGAQVVDLEIDITQWALALTSLASRPATMEFRDAAFGRISEHKEELVPDLGALAPFCVDGWKPRQGDYGNNHCYVSKGEKRFCRVIFHRYVEPTPGALTERYKRINESRALDGLPALSVPEAGV